MVTTEEALQEAGKALWAKWAMVSDPGQIDRRWSMMRKNMKQAWIEEAKAAIEAYEYLKGHR